MKLLIIGVTGQVARALVQHPVPGSVIVARGRPALDLSNSETIDRAINAVAPDVVINAGAYTAVDQAESAYGEAHRINALGPGIVARQCALNGVPLVHISTDYVFSGDKAAPYAETDPVNPQSAYGRTKLEGEQRVAAAWSRHVILRTAWVYSHEGKNFVRSMLRLAATRPSLGVVDDQQGCPTYADDLAAAIVAVARKMSSSDASDLGGVFHAVGDGSCTWREFAEAIFNASAARGGPRADVQPIATAEYPTPAKRPANSRLDCGKLERVYGVRLPSWRNSLDACMDRIAAGGFAVH